MKSTNRRGADPRRARPGRPWTVTWLLLWSGLCAAGCRFTGDPQPIMELEQEPWGKPHEVLVEVNGRPVTRGEFYVRVLRRFGTAKLLSGVIKEELFLQEAERMGLQVSRAEIDEKVDAILAELATEAGGEQQLEEQYQREGLSLQSARRDLAREVSTQLLIGKVCQSRRTIDDNVLQEYYKQTYRHRRFFARQIAYSYLADPSASDNERKRRRMEAENRAVRAADRVRSGADFAALARAESEDPVTAPRGGELGPVHEETPMKYPQFKEAIFALAPGDVSEPIENPDGGFHVFTVDRIISSESFADCRDRMAAELRSLDPDVREIESVLRDLQSRGNIRVHGLPFVGAAVGGGAGKCGRTSAGRRHRPGQRPGGWGARPSWRWWREMIRDMRREAGQNGVSSRDGELPGDEEMATSDAGADGADEQFDEVDDDAEVEAATSESDSAAADLGELDDEDEDEEVDDVAGDGLGLQAVGLDRLGEGERRPVRSDSGAELESQDLASQDEGSEEELVLEPEQVKGVVEAVLFSVSEPMTIRALSEVTGATVHEIRSAVEELRYEYVDSGRSFRLEDISGGVQILTRSSFSPWVRRLREKEREGRLSAAALETLSVVAYKQPIAKADLEGIRGVGCSQILKTLMDRDLVQVVGRDEGLGRALLYGTTSSFLEQFGLGSVKDLPQPEDLKSEEEKDAGVSEQPQAENAESEVASAPVSDQVELDEDDDSFSVT